MFDSSVKYVVVTFILIAIFVDVAAADKWGLPKVQNVKSPSKRYRVAVTPPKSNEENGAIISLWDESDGKTRLLYRRRPVNRRSPVKVFVSDDGSVITLDDWGQAGYEHAVVIYRPSGEIVLDARLDSILTAKELEKVKRTVSSRHWYYLAEPIKVLADKLEVTALWGITLMIDLKTGTVNRGTKLFPNLVRLSQGDLSSLVRIEYESWSSDSHKRCTWESNKISCEIVGEDGKSTPFYQKRFSRTQLREKLAPIRDLLQAVESPTYCAVGCAGNEAVRLFFRENLAEYSYSVEGCFPDLPASTRDSFDKLRRGLGFKK